MAAAGTLAGAALTLEGCGHGRSTKEQVKKPGPVPAEDVPLLEGLLDLERKTIAAYEAGIPLLDPVTAKAAQQLLRHELSHAGELTGLLKKAGTKAPEPRGGYNLGHPRNAAQIIALLHDLENAQVTAYLTTIPRLSSGPVRAALAAVLANDAQHVTILRASLRLPAAPAAFVTGRE